MTMRRAISFSTIFFIGDELKNKVKLSYLKFLKVQPCPMYETIHIF